MPFGPWPGSGGASSAGGVNSLTPPTGAPAPTAVYDFTLFDPAATAAQRLLTANRADAALDLVADAADLTPMGFRSAAGGNPKMFVVQAMPFSQSPQGGGLLVKADSAPVHTTGSPAALQISGDITVEWVGSFTVIAAGALLFLPYWQGAVSVDPIDNGLYGVYWDQVTGWRYFQKNGAGVLTDIVLAVTTLVEESVQREVVQCMTYTRKTVAGVTTIRLYRQGRLMSETVCPAGNPDGGTAGDLKIGHTLLGSMTTLFTRITAGAFSDEQVREAYTRTMYGT